MRVGLIGFGRTGKSVASTILDDGDIRLEWVVRRSSRLEHRSVPEFLGVDSSEPGVIHSKNEYSAGELLDLKPVDAIVDFSSPSALDYYGAAAAEREVAIVSGISHYDEERAGALERLARRTRVLWSPNITVGINFLMLAARTLKSIAPHTDIEIIEEHFSQKSEVSGTAVRIADSLELGADEIKSVRAGGIIGTHEILFGFPYQTVRLKHESISREAFGNGALFALRHLLGRPKGFYRMEDLMIPYFTEATT